MLTNLLIRTRGSSIFWPEVQIVILHFRPRCQKVRKKEITMFRILIPAAYADGVWEDICRILQFCS
jgi:hypothetical protein